MKNLLLVVFFGLPSVLMLAQNTTYADDIAPILFEKCTGCHHSGGAADIQGSPGPLMTYTEAFNNRYWIQSAVNARIMPPWPPNNNFSQFVHDRSLSDAQIQAINDWVADGGTQGNMANAPNTPVYTNGPQLGTPDLSIKMPNYISKATTSNDDYVCFSIPSNLLSDRMIKAVEIIPGNPAIVHHCLVYLDPSGNYPTDTLSHFCGGPSSDSIPLITEFVPGSSPIAFPDDNLLRLGVDMQANSKVILAMHYPEGSQGQLDSTRVNIHFYPTSATGIRPMNAGPIIGDYNFTIQSNTIDSVEAYYPDINTPLPADYSVYSVFPHMHLLGKSFIVYGINHSAPYDTIPFIHIPAWDFEWQGFYVFKNLQKIPAGYKIYAKAVYDNTTNNPLNPNNPPQDVSFGLNTTDEMFLVYFQYTNYQAGDELINVDSLIQLQNNTYIPPLASYENGLFLTSFPNPSDDLTTLLYYSPSMEKVHLRILDINGRTLKTLLHNVLQSGEQQIQWDGRDNSGQKLPPGLYFSQLKVGNKTTTQQISRY